MKKSLQVAHVVPMTPHKSGMYETARELIHAERQLGIDAFVIDPRPDEEQVRKMIEKSKTRKLLMTIKCPYCHKEVEIYTDAGIKNTQTRVPDWTEDRGIWSAPMVRIEDSDVIVSHSGLFGLVRYIDKPIVHIMHGIPRSSFLIGMSGDAPIYSLYRQWSKQANFEYFITLWEEYLDFWKVLIPERKLLAFNSFVDLDYFTPDDSYYGFGNAGSQYNIVLPDTWRRTKDPYFVLHGFIDFAQKHRSMDFKLHIYGVDEGMRESFAPLLDVIKDNGWLGEVKGLVDNIKEIYQSADVVLTSANVASRVVREALACGRQVVAGYKCQWTPYNAYEGSPAEYGMAIEKALMDWIERREEVKKRNRMVAEENFDLRATAKQFVELYKELINSWH